MQRLTLAEGQVHIWLVDPTAISTSELLERYHQLMTADENAKWQRYKFEKDKHQHLVTRALIRDTLSRYEPQVAPADWRFEQNPHGKPAIANALRQPLYFNLSHTQNLAALAVTRSGTVGIDVEKIKPMEQVRGLAERCFVEDEVSFVFAGEKNSLLWRFFKLWTLKEAYIKARGCGMSLSLHAVRFAAEAHPLTVSFDLEHDDQPEAWAFRHWQLGPEHLMSLAINLPTESALNISHFRGVPMGDFAVADISEKTSC